MRMSVVNSNGVHSSLSNGSQHVNGSGNNSPTQSQSPNGSQQNHHHSTNKGTIERGASWSYNETRLLLSLWGQDMVQRQLTNSKRTKHVWEKIAEKIREHGFERKSDQVRTRVFNMIAEYRRILKNPSAERKKKCIFFDALHRIYQAKDISGVRAALNYDEESNNFGDTPELTIDEGPESSYLYENGEGNESGTENEEVFAYHMSPSQTLNHPTSLNGHNYPNHDSGPNRNIKRIKSESQVNQYSSAINNGNLNGYGYDGSYALLVDRMFKHLNHETEVMKDWIKLEKERFQYETMRRKEEKERDERREKAFLDTLTNMSERLFNFLENYTGDRGPLVANQDNSANSMCYNSYSQDHGQQLGAHFNMGPAYHSQ